MFVHWLGSTSRLVYERDSQVGNVTNQVLPQLGLDPSAAKSSFPLLVLDGCCLLSHGAISSAFKPRERARSYTAETSSRRKPSPQLLQDQPGSHTTRVGLHHIQDHPVHSTSLLAPSGVSLESDEGTRYAAMLPSHVYGRRQCMIKGEGCSSTGRALVGRRMEITCKFYGQMLWMGPAG